MEKSNIVLIGMPNSGKSTVGKHLATVLNMDFVDTDQLIFEQEKKPLKDIVQSDGLEKFLSIQEDIVKSLKVENSVIATGGSVIYSSISMEHLKSTGFVVFLDIDYEKVVSRLSSGRRFARQENQSLLDVYNERLPLYRKYADIILKCSDMTAERIALEIIRLLKLK